MSTVMTEEASDAAVGVIGRKAMRGLSWSVGGTAISKIGGLALGLVLARLLAPTDFGIYAVALAATQFVMMIKDLGVIAATMHWRGPLEEMTPTASTIALVFSTVLYGIFWIGAPSFSALAGNPEATNVVRLLTAVILVEGVAAVRSGVLMRDFRQDRLIVANMCGLVVNAAVAITLALGGAGAMSFAAGQVAAAVVIGVIVYTSVGIPMRLGFDRAVAAKLLRFGLPLAGGLALEAVLLNADFVIVGHALGATLLGYYLLAFNIASWTLTTLTASIRYVSVAGFSRLSELDADVLSDGAQRSFSLLIKVVLPICALTAALASEVILALYGESWSPAASVLRFLALLTIVRVLISFALDILMGAGSTRAMLWINLLWAIALIPALILGVHLWGINGAGIAHAAVGVTVALPLTYVAMRRLGIRLAPIGPGLLRPALASLASAAVAYALISVPDTPAILGLLVAGVGGLATYVVVAFPLAELRRWARIATDRLSRNAGRTSVPGEQVQGSVT